MRSRHSLAAAFLSSATLAAALAATIARAQSPTVALPHASKDILDFHDWTATGQAFAGQPVDAAEATTDRFASIPLGGDYWRGLPYPLGQEGRALVLSGMNGDAAIGRFTSPPFVLSDATPVFTVMIGGSDDAARVRVELQVNDSPGPFDPARARVVLSGSGPGHEQLRLTALKVPDGLGGRAARVAIVDESPTAHINVGAIRFSAGAPVPQSIPVWGYADYHTHPMTHRAFGALKGMRTIWGQPGGRYTDYERAPALVAMDLPPCESGHGGGPFAGPFLNAAQKLQYKDSLDLLFRHPNHGWPDFANHPSFIQGAHQQMHVTQIRRNFDGGLRLLVALATDNVGAEYLMSSVGEDGHVPLVEEKASLEAQLAGMKDLALLNGDWMEIAYTAAHAREIILRNKLAVVLGIEMDRLGTYGCSSAAEEVDYLWDLGVRVVTPIHAANNRLGGAAAFIGPYNWLNDLLHRGKFDVSRGELDDLPAAFFDVDEQTCALTQANDGECVQNRLDWKKQNRLYLGRCAVSVLQAGLKKSPCLDETRWKPYDEKKRGHTNALGLTAYGATYLDALMAKGMIIDTAHMSDKSVAGTFGVIGQKLARDHPQCPGFSFRSDVSPECNALAYPAIISHAHFRGQAYYGKEEFPPTEYDISNRNLEMVRRVGGVVGPFVAEDRISTRWDGTGRHPTNDCAMSSKSFAYAFRFAAQRLGRFGVGMATDFTLIPQTSPRFGENACWGYHVAKNPGKELRAHKKRYAKDAQADGVVYEGVPREGVRYGTNAKLIPYRLGKREYDFNTDGLAHFGLVPDMLQDLKNVGVPDEDRALMFRSSEDYIRMWERTSRAAHGPSTTNRP